MDAVRLNRRLLRVEQQAGAADPGCPDCRDRRGLTAAIICQRLPDGTTTDAEGGPAPCERCGEVPEKVVRIVEVVVKSRKDPGPPGGRGPARAGAAGRKGTAVSLHTHLSRLESARAASDAAAFIRRWEALRDDPRVSAAEAAVRRLMREADAAAGHPLPPAKWLDIPGIDEAMQRLFCAVNACEGS
jgi:hypothetical protein